MSLAMRLALISALCVAVAPALSAPKPKTAAAASAPTATEPTWRTPDPDNLLIIDTNKGRVIAELYPDIAPATVERVKTLAKRHFYDGLLFFRVIDGFMDQTGDPQNTGAGASELPNVKAEFDFRRGPELPFTPAVEKGGMAMGFIGALPVITQTDGLMALTNDGKVSGYGLFCSGVLGFARAESPDSGNSQFFLMRDTSTSLNHKYTPWGRVLVGQDAVNAIKVGEPVEPPMDKMITVRLASDLPEAQRPKVQVTDTHSPGFAALLKADAAAKGETFNACDVAVPARVAG